MVNMMKQIVLLLGLCAFVSAAHAADMGLDEVQALGRLNGQALACSQTENIHRIKAVMIDHAPKSRQYGATFEQLTHEFFLLRSSEQEACVDAPLIALQVEDLAARLSTMFPAGAKQ
jgi:hypothetical protein